MVEYIEREAACMEAGYIHGFGDDKYVSLKDIESIPAADVVPVVHGRWEVVHGVLTPGGDPLLRCPICKARESEHLCGVECRTVWNYCPNCGARMDG